MKANARLASAPWSKPIDATAPGVTAFIKQLKAYQTAHPDLEVHLVGHSAGSVMLAGVVERLAAEGIPVESLQLMAGAISIDEFLSDVASHLVGVPGSDGMVKRFTAYDLEEKWELDDVCPGPPTPGRVPQVVAVLRGPRAGARLLLGVREADGRAGPDDQREAEVKPVEIPARPDRRALEPGARAEQRAATRFPVEPPTVTGTSTTTRRR